eukprot:scaffold93712_cov69-Phaeocystis_antarctica.AAC.5
MVIRVRHAQACGRVTKGLRVLDERRGIYVRTGRGRRRQRRRRRRRGGGRRRRRDRRAHEAASPALDPAWRRQLRGGFAQLGQRSLVLAGEARWAACVRLALHVPLERGERRADDEAVDRAAHRAGYAEARIDLQPVVDPGAGGVDWREAVLADDALDGARHRDPGDARRPDERVGERVVHVDAHHARVEPDEPRAAAWRRLVHHLVDAVGPLR